MIVSFSNNFKRICEDFIDVPRNFVLGLSGGSDSTALLYLLKSFVTRNPELKINIYPVIIDHGLRSVSTLEAMAVKKKALKLGFHAIIKKINNKKPKGNIQKWARDERRNLLHESAVYFSASLLLAHHYDDQVETVFMRLKRGSGIDGLQGIKEINFWNGILIIRPLLIFKKEIIKNYIKKHNINFYNDLSNNMLQYERVRTRKTLVLMEKSFWPKVSYDLNKLCLLNKRLLILINPHFIKWIEENIVIDEIGAIKINFANLKILFLKSNLVGIKILGKVLQIVGGKEYSPKKLKTYNLMQSILTSCFKTKNLGNVNINLNENSLFFIREQRNLSFDMEIHKNKYYIFDGRFLLISKVSGKLVKSNKKYLNNVKEESIFFRYKKEINNSLPSIETLEGKSVRPYLCIINNETFEKQSMKDSSFTLYLINKLLV